MIFSEPNRVKNSISITWISFVVLIIIAKSSSCEPTRTFLELSNAGLKIGLDRPRFDAYVRFDSHFHGNEYETKRSTKDSVFYDDAYSTINMDFEFGIGFDKYFLSDSFRVGFRSDASYVYPYSSGDHNYEHINQFELKGFLAVVGIYSFKSIALGGSVGPLAVYTYRHAIFDYESPSNEKLSSNTIMQDISIGYSSEILARYSF